jgi:hypothetical protein
MQKLQSVFQIEEIVETAKETVAETLQDKDVNMTEINHLIYPASTAITGAINETGCYKSLSDSPKPSLWVRRMQESRNVIRKDLSAVAEMKRDETKTEIEKKEIIKEKSQRFSG